jgi:hypothetical protein
VPTQPPVQKGTWGSFPEIKRPGREIHSLQTTVGVKKCGSGTSLTSRCFTLLYYFNINNTVTSGVDNSKYLALDPYILLGLIFQTIFS